MNENNKPTVIDDVKSSYDEIVRELKKKYSDEILRRVDELKAKSYESVSRCFSQLSQNLFVEIQELKDVIKKQKTDFYKSKDYVDAQADLKRLRQELTISDGQSKKDVEKRLARAMDRVSTLNVTINNRIKPAKEKLSADMGVLKGASESDDSFFVKLRDEFLSGIDAIVSEGIEEYNRELSEINGRFGIKSSGVEVPFEAGELKIRIELFPKELDDDERKFVESENDNPLKN